MNKGGFSWKRLSGYSGTKSKISKSTGVPFTKSGRDRKLGSYTNPEGSGGCLVVLTILGASIITMIQLI
jgi:hypothetical protein